MDFNTGKNDLSAELKRAKEMQAQKNALAVDSAEWDAWTDFNSAASIEIRELNDALESFEHEQIFQNGIGVISNATYQELRKILKKL